MRFPFVRNSFVPLFVTNVFGVVSDNFAVQRERVSPATNVGRKVISGGGTPFSR